MITVGIVGCGKVADQHLTQIARIPHAHVVGVCDQELLMAQQLGERFRIPKSFTSVEELLRVSRPDVVHITTPPHSHFHLGKSCLEVGCNVYIEKPFTLNTAEAEELISIANRKGLRLTAGHNAQFTHAMREMRHLVREGYLGGSPVHMESIYCYNLGNESYAKALLGDKRHWVKQLPGSLLQNIISHGISRIAEFMTGKHPKVMASSFTSPFLKNIGQGDIIDEVRVIIQGSDFCTAYFTFSTQISPTVHYFRLFGPKNSLIVDDDHQILIKVKDNGYKSYLKFFLPPFDYARQYLNNLGRNAKKFLNRDLHMPFDAGMKTLIESFYASVSRDAPLPISYREILMTSNIMDQIFAQIGQRNPA